LTLPKRPDGIAKGAVCPLSGKKPTAACPHRKQEFFVRGSEAKQNCDWHHQTPVGVRINYPSEIQAWAKRHSQATGEYFANLVP
jgi:hypothetical protein